MGRSAWRQRATGAKTASACPPKVAQDQAGAAGTLDGGAKLVGFFPGLRSRAHLIERRRAGAVKRNAQDAWIVASQDLTITLRHCRVGGKGAVARISGTQL